jgi:hypothetical protein
MQIGETTYTVDILPNLVVHIQKIQLISKSVTFEYDVLQHIFIRDYEITDKDLLRSLSIKGRRIHESTCNSFTSSKEYEHLIPAEDYIKSEVIKRIDGYQEKLKNRMTCPLTNQPLYYIGSDEYVMDGPVYYGVEKCKHRYSHSGRIRSDCATWYTEYNGKKYEFILKENKLVRIISTYASDECIENPTPFQIQFIEDFNQLWSDVKQSIREINREIRLITTGDPRQKFSILGQTFYEVLAQTVSLEQVTVCPMSAPLGILHYLDYTYKGDSEKEKRIIPNAEIIQSTLEDITKYII